MQPRNILALTFLFACVALVTFYNCWQGSHIESRIIQMQQTLVAVQQELANLDAALRRGAPRGQTSPDLPVTDAECPGNLLITPRPLLPENASYGGTLNRAIAFSSKGYNPVTQHSADIMEIARYVVANLAHYDLDDPNRYAGDLARCVTVNEDHTVYTVQLHEGLLWHPIQPSYLVRSPWLAGEHPITTDDFIYALDMILDPAVEGAAPLRSYYQDFDRIEKISDTAFRLIWKKTTYQSLDFSLELAPLPRWIYAYDPDGNPYPEAERGARFNDHWYLHMMGAGPYRFADFTPQSFARLSRHQGYRGERPAFDEIIYRVVKNPAQHLAQLRAGELDLIDMQPAQYRAEILTRRQDGAYTDRLDARGQPLDGKLGYALYPRMSYRYIGWNQMRPFFADARVRLAMTHALNREHLLQDVFMGLGVPTSGAAYVGSPEYDRRIEPWPYDPARAAALLDEAGWIDSNHNGTRDKDGVEFRFTLLTYDYRPEFIAMAEYYKEELKRLGIEMSVTALDWPALQSRIAAKNFDAFTGGWMLSWNSDLFQIWHSSQADLPDASNRVGFRNPDADAIIEAARITFDKEERVRLFHAFHAILHREQPYTFLFADVSVAAWRPELRNVVFQQIRPHDLSLPWYRALP